MIFSLQKQKTPEKFRQKKTIVRVRISIRVYTSYEVHAYKMNLCAYAR